MSPDKKSQIDGNNVSFKQKPPRLGKTMTYFENEIKIRLDDPNWSNVIATKVNVQRQKKDRKINIFWGASSFAMAGIFVLVFFFFPKSVKQNEISHSKMIHSQVNGVYEQVFNNNVQDKNTQSDATNSNEKNENIVDDYLVSDTDQIITAALDRR